MKASLDMTQTNAPPLDPEAQARLDRHRGRFVPWIIVAFFLSFVLLLLSFVMIAVKNPPSEVTSEAYNKGLAYNQILAQSEAQAHLGWQVKPRFERGILSLSLSDKDGQALKGALVHVWLKNANNAHLDQETDLLMTHEGVYAKSLVLPDGLYHAHITSSYGGHQYQSEIDIDVAK